MIGGAQRRMEDRTSRAIKVTGFGAYGIVLRRVLRMLGDTAALVYAHLSTYAEGGDGDLADMPMAKRLAKDLDKPLWVIHTALAELEDKGVITVSEYKGSKFFRIKF